MCMYLLIITLCICDRRTIILARSIETRDKNRFVERNDEVVGYKRMCVRARVVGNENTAMVGKRKRKEKSTIF